MKVPKYIQRLLGRCEWAVEKYHGPLPEYLDPGYTIFLHKRNAYARAKTLEQEARSIKDWCDRQMKRLDPDYDPEKHSVATIHYCPKTTIHHDQWTVIAIYDPVMQSIEKLIPEKTKK